MLTKKLAYTPLLASVVLILISTCFGCATTEQTSLNTTTVIDGIHEERIQGTLSKELWIKKADMPTGRTCNAVVVNSKIYTLGTNDQAHISVEEYDPKANKWIKKNSVSKMTNKGVFALASIAGKIYVAGGYNEKSLNLVEEYNPLNDTWTTKKSMPVPVDCSSAISVNGKLYVIGGVNTSNRVTGNVQEYGPAKNSWTLKESMPTPRSEFGVAEVKGKIYALGGNWGTGFETEEYDPAQNKWTRKENMLSRCMAFQAVSANEKIYTIFRGTIQEYDPTSNKWTLKNKSPEDKLWLNGATSFNNKIYVLGGLKGEIKESPKGEVLKTVWQYDPSEENTQLYNTSASLKKIIDKYAADNKFNGTVLVAKDGEILLSQGYGKADVDKNVPITTKTRFSLASVTKQFTAVAIMQLEEKGLLAVSDPITKYFEGYTKWKDITINNLLNHTSGITRDISFMFDAKEHSPEVLEVIKDVPLEFKPGTSFSYCNTGYNILGFIIEKVTGQPYDKYMAENIFNPLGMSNTACAVTASAKDICAKGYAYDQGKLVRQDVPDLYKLVGCCNIYSNVEDMYIWGSALYTDKLLKKDALDNLFTPGLNNYANGWFISTINGRKVAIHGGGCDGVSTRMVKYLDKSVVIVLLTNAGNCDLNAPIADLDFALFNSN